MTSYFDDKDLPHFGDLKAHAPELWNAFEKYYAAAYSTVIFLILLIYGSVQNRITRATEAIAG